MNSSVRALAAVVIITLLVPLAWANGGRPPNLQPAKVIPEDMGKTLSSKKAQYVTTFDPKATRTRLVIPQKFVGGSAKDAPKDASKDAPKTSGVGSGNTLMAGLALSLGVVSGGVWWSRRGNGGLGKGKIVLLAIGVLGASVLAASALFADLAVPKGKGFPGPNPALGMPRADIDIEITDKGDTVYLVIPGGGGGFGFGGGFGGPPPPGGLVPPGGGILGPGNPSLPSKDASAQPPLNPLPKKGGQEE